MDINYLRVTQVLSSFSGLDKIDPLVLKNAGARGTCVHKICDYIMNNEIYDVDEEIKKYTVNEMHFWNEKMQVERLVESFKLWFSEKKILRKPERFYDSSLMITGECDLIYQGDDGLVLVDLKTPANESKTWLLQGSAYSYLANKCGHNIQRIEFVKLSKDGKCPKVFEYSENFNLFRSCLETYRYFYQNPKPETVYDYL